MQGKRSTLEQFPEAFEFNRASSSSSWANVLTPGDAQNLPDYLLSPNEPNMSYRNGVNHETESSSDWTLRGSSSTELITSQTDHIETKMENGWISSLTANARAGPSLEERRLEETNMLSLHNVGINLNSNQISQDQLFLQNSGSNDAALTLVCNADLTGNGEQLPHSGICPLYNPFVSEAEQIPSGSRVNTSRRTSSRGVNNLSEDADGRHGSSLDSRRSSGKRKNVEGASGQSSGSGTHSCFQQTENDLLHTVSARHVPSSSLNISTSPGNLSRADPPEEHLNLRYNAGVRGAASEHVLSASVDGSAESSQRNFRMRMNPANQTDSSTPNLWLSGNSGGQPSVWLPHQPSALLIPFNQSFEGRLAMPTTSSQSQSHSQSVPGLPQLAHPLTRNGTPNLRIGGSSNSQPGSTERSATPREESNSWRTQRNNVPEQPIFVPATDVRHVAQESTDWNLANGNIDIPGIVPSTSRIGSSSGVHPTTTPTRVPHQNQPNQYQQTPEFVRRTFPTANSEPGSQLNDFFPQRLGHSSSPQEITRQPGVALRTHQQQLLRSAFLMDRRSDVLGAPLMLRTLAAAREGRSRIISEHIRNALDLMRRSENIRFEDVLILDQSAFYGLADLHDRHRDMRLDVDNMSYEELLALEERIGSVSTGLSEEAIVKHLKHRNYLSLSEPSSSEVEPCCICQEDYLDSEDVGTLDCGHDFHTACIKQWLTYKNVCPICKSTALVA